MMNEKTISKKEKRYRKLISYNTDNDIKFHGIIGIRGLRILGWFFIILTVIALSLSLCSSSGAINPDDGFAKFSIVSCSFLGQLAVPCIMLSRFGLIYQKKNNVKNMLITFGLLALGVTLLYLLLYFHYGITFVEKLYNVDYFEAKNIFEAFLHDITSSKICFNIFLDMFLWSLYFAIINYEFKEPKLYKTIFKYIASSLPFIYVLVWFIMKILFCSEVLDINAALLPFIPSVTPLLFLTFIVVSIFISKRKTMYLKIGGTEEGYSEYLKTNVNSFHFARITAISFAVVGILDFVFMTIIYIVNPIYADSILSITGVANSLSYLIFAPFILLFSYTKEFKNNKIDLLVPIVSIIIIALIMFEGLFESIIYWLSYIYTM